MNVSSPTSSPNRSPNRANSNNSITRLLDDSSNRLEPTLSSKIFHKLRNKDWRSDARDKLCWLYLLERLIRWGRLPHFDKNANLDDFIRALAGASCGFTLTELAADIEIAGDGDLAVELRDAIGPLPSAPIPRNDKSPDATALPTKTVEKRTADAALAEEPPQKRAKHDDGSPLPAVPLQQANNPRGKGPRTFISYSWTPESNQIWALELSKRLIERGVDVRDAARIIFICTDEYYRKANSDAPGATFSAVGYEVFTVMNALRADGLDLSRHIPLLRQGGTTKVIPLQIAGPVYQSLENLDDAPAFESLLRRIYGASEFIRPPAGPRATFAVRQ
jgi:hypothetical protein